MSRKNKPPIWEGNWRNFVNLWGPQQQLQQALTLENGSRENISKEEESGRTALQREHQKIQQENVRAALQREHQKAQQCELTAAEKIERTDMQKAETWSRVMLKRKFDQQKPQKTKPDTQLSNGFFKVESPTKEEEKLAEKPAENARSCSIA